MIDPPAPDSALRSDPGRVRTNNEDAVGGFEPADDALRAERGCLYVVADGMGGHLAGEVASNYAVASILRDYFMQPWAGVEPSLRAAVAAANTAIHEEGSLPGEHQGMGCTVVAAALAGDRAVIINVGDSRAYLLRDGQLRQISLDHSWIAERVAIGLLTPEEAVRHPGKNVLTRNLGFTPDTEPSVADLTLADGDRLLLCSDGLSGPVKDDRIAMLLAAGSAEQAAAALIAAANESGGPDNIGVAVIAVGGARAVPPADTLDQLAPPVWISGESEQATLAAEPEPQTPLPVIADLADPLATTLELAELPSESVAPKEEPAAFVAPPEAAAAFAPPPAAPATLEPPAGAPAAIAAAPEPLPDQTAPFAPEPTAVETMPVAGPTPAAPEPALPAADGAPPRPEPPIGGVPAPAFAAARFLPASPAAGSPPPRRSRRPRLIAGLAAAAVVVLAVVTGGIVLAGRGGSGHTRAAQVAAPASAPQATVVAAIVPATSTAVAAVSATVLPAPSATGTAAPLLSAAPPASATTIASATPAGDSVNPGDGSSTGGSGAATGGAAAPLPTGAAPPGGVATSSTGGSSSGGSSGGNSTGGFSTGGSSNTTGGASTGFSSGSSGSPNAASGSTGFSNGAAIGGVIIALPVLYHKRSGDTLQVIWQDCYTQRFKTVADFVRQFALDNPRNPDFDSLPADVQVVFPGGFTGDACQLGKPT